MNSLNLDIVEGVYRNVETCSFLDPLLNPDFAIPFDFNELVYEILVGCVGDELLEIVKRRHPFIDSSHSIAEQL